MMKKYLLIILVACVGVNAYPLPEQQQLAERAVIAYYDLLESLLNNPTPGKEEQIKSLFNERGNVVFNDLYVVERQYGNGLIDENQNADIDSYMATIRNLWANGQKLSIMGKIDKSSFIETIEQIDSVNRKNAIWVTATKIITLLGHQINNERETFKVVNGKIESIRTPEDATTFSNFWIAYHYKQYDKAYEAFLHKISLSSKLKDDHDFSTILFNIVVWLKKGKVKNIPKDVQKWLSIYYEAKYYGFEYLPINERYSAKDMAYLIDDTTTNQPFIHGLMPIFKGGERGFDNYLVGEKYGYMNEEGKMITPFCYSWAEPFSKQYGVARVVGNLISSTELCGVINTKGELITQPKYISIRPFYNGLAAVKDVFKKWGFIDITGKEVIPCTYNSVTDYSCGWYGFSDGERCYYKNLYGEFINEDSYLGNWTFDEQTRIAIISKNINGKERLGCIDSFGNEILPPAYYDIRLNGKDGTITLQETFESEKKTIKIKDLKYRYISH